MSPPRRRGFRAKSEPTSARRCSRGICTQHATGLQASGCGQRWRNLGTASVVWKRRGMERGGLGGRSGVGKRGFEIAGAGWEGGGSDAGHLGYGAGRAPSTESVGMYSISYCRYGGTWSGL